MCVESQIVNLKRLELKAKLFNGFADLSRLKILESMLKDEKSVNEIVEFTGLSQPNVSSHLKCLSDCQLVQSEKNGRKNYYSPINEKIKELLILADEILDQIEMEINNCSNYEVNQ
ncbi:MAG: winged helix-turn-helix transcriptional regulator [Candidatus Heimdallarchaeota archaeon]|nr:winged helix-turn-helix transcriptional regulator [Candidatus Heimdallarchaeota archaeon]